MLNQPINVIPSVLSGVGEGVVDATLPLTVSWQVSGDTPMLAYQIVIQQNDTDSTEVYDSGKVTLLEPFYGNDRNGNIQMFSANEITAAELSTAGIINGYTNGYKIVITQWWGATDDDSITQTSPSYFVTRDTPTVTIDIPSYTESNPYNRKSITVDASFTQAQGDTVKTVRWYLYNGQEDNAQNLLLDTGDIETQLLQFYYDGLFPENYYLLQVSIQSSSGTTVNAQSVIYVEYPLGQDVGEVTVCKPVGKDYIEVSWNARSYIAGETSGDVSYTDGAIHIESGDTLAYDPMNIEAPWSLAWRGSANISGGDTINIVNLSDGSDSLVLSLSNTAAKFSYNGNIIFSKTITGHSSDVFTFVITPSHYYIRQDTYSGGTIPSESLYPSSTLYPSESTSAVNFFDGAITYTQFNIASLVLNGEQTCDYILIESGEMSQEQIQQILGDTYYQPIIDYNTMFLSNFDSETTIAFMSGTGGKGLGSAVYRRAKGKQILEHVVDAAGGVTAIRDYGALSRTEYQYYVFLIGINIYAEAFGSGTITPQYNNYTLMECIYNSEDGAYHVQASYPFACNVSQGAISNNNTPNVMQNFTRYPNRQSVNTRYASGTLTALIGTVNQTEGTYTDTWELADKISELSTSQNPKFLRDMKGKIWRVETSSAITTEISTSNVFMPLKVTIPWVEVGSSEAESIVATPSDPVFLIDTVSQTSLDINPQTGRLVWTRPDDYAGTIISLNGSQLVSTTPSDVYPAKLNINKDGFLIVNT